MPNQWGVTTQYHGIRTQPRWWEGSPHCWINKWVCCLSFTWLPVSVLLVPSLLTPSPQGALRTQQQILRFFRNQSHFIYDKPGFCQIAHRQDLWHFWRQQSQWVELLIHVRFSSHNGRNLIFSSGQGTSSQLQVLYTQAIKSSDRSKHQEEVIYLENYYLMEKTSFYLQFRDY